SDVPGSTDSAKPDLSLIRRHPLDGRRARRLECAFEFIFPVVGLLGMQLVLSDRGPSHPALFVDPPEKWPYFVFFLGVALTTFGSGYYHADPNNARLVCDRLPMTIGFMSLLAAMVDERI